MAEKMNRINVTLDDETLEALDGIGNGYGMNRSETIRFMTSLIVELDALKVLENVVIDGFEYTWEQVNAYKMMAAAAKCHVARDEE